MSKVKVPSVSKSSQWQGHLLSCFGQLKRRGIAPGHGKEEANRWVCFVTTLCCPLAEVSPHTPRLSRRKKKLIWVICQQKIFKQSKKLIGNLFSAPWAFTTSSTRAINLSSLSFRSMLIWVLGNSSNTCRWLAEKYFYWSQPHLLSRYETDLVKRGKTSALGSDIEINKIFAGCKVDAHLGGENK